MASKEKKKLYEKILNVLIIEAARLEIVKRSPKSSPCGFEVIENIAQEGVEYTIKIQKKIKANRKIEKEKKRNTELIKINAD